MATDAVPKPSVEWIRVVTQRITSVAAMETGSARIVAPRGGRGRRGRSRAALRPTTS
jgi:hypothetical protein